MQQRGSLLHDDATHIRNLDDLDVDFPVTQLGDDEFDSNGVKLNSVCDDASPNPVHVVGTGSIFGAMFNSLKCYLGVGVLSLPSAFAQAGLIGGIIGTVVLALFNYYTCHIFVLSVIQLQKKYPGLESVSFGTLGYMTGGKTMRYLMNFGVIALQCGCCIAYSIFICSNVNAVFPELAFWQVQLMLLVPFIILCSIRDMKNLMPVSFAGILVLFLSLGIVLSAGFTKSGPSPDYPNGFVFSTYPLFIGTAAFAFEGIAMSMPIRQSMAKPEKYDSFVLPGTYVVVSLVYIAVGWMGLVLFGKDVPGGSDILSEISSNNLKNVVRILYCVVLFFSYPVQLFGAIMVFEKKWRNTVFLDSTAKTTPLLPAAEPDSGSPDHHHHHHSAHTNPCLKAFVLRWPRVLLRVVLVAVLMLIAIAAKDQFNNFLSLIGAVAGGTLSFMGPVFFYMRTHELTTTSKVFHSLFMLVSVGLCVLALVQAIQGFFKN
eukprot:gnl/Spiro4/25066_TR12470_c0_g1_i1.p1 gnl/Spiro4/25066_TR12470_c0_g1~~gnl/Spiro4/25066_TR12470_c0_g1_i1.p1  ORF type:complete len:502 (-),score=94.70 gnl/Spiro4/25066_TR12470_c0_g1_i1:71-1525(-)